jgi:hypothetical protein
MERGASTRGREAALRGTWTAGARATAAALLLGVAGSATTCLTQQPHWIHVGPLAAARVDHAAALAWSVPPDTEYFDPRVVVCGGTDGTGTGPTARTEVWLGSGWTEVMPMQRARAGHTAVTLWDGMVLVAGGAPDCPACAERYDPVADTWTETGAMTDGRAAHAAALLADGRVLVAGGLDAAGAPLASADLFDPQTGSWTPAADMAWPRAHHTATRLADGRVLVVGGETFASAPDPGEVRDGAEVYDPATDAWTPVAPVLAGRWDHTATVMTGGLVLVAGGRVRRAGETPLVREAEQFDPTRDVFVPAHDLRRARASHVAALMPDGRVVIAGGTANDVAGTSPVDRVEYYWGARFERGPEMFTERSRAVAVAWTNEYGGGLGGRTTGGVAVIGGVSDAGMLADAEALLEPAPPSCK